MYRSKLVVNPDLDRTLVSFQANRTLPFYRWLKYKEGFSAEFVRYVIEHLAHRPGVLLDPFAGTGTALFAAREMGWDTIGIELLPIGFFTIEARLAAETVILSEFRKAVEKVGDTDWSMCWSPKRELAHVPITKGAFPKRTEKSIAGYQAYCARLRNTSVRKLFELACLSVLESVSYTRKDGQYLRWDSRAERDRPGSSFRKNSIPSFETAIRQKLREICNDLSRPKQAQGGLFEARSALIRPGSMDLRKGSCLEVLPKMDAGAVDLVITSPPYCNRYDYTRTYALELVFLGANSDEIKSLRQTLLSCTVENRTKEEQLRTIYGNAFDRVHEVFRRQQALREATDILDELGAAGRLNNSNIPNMVKNYFLEMAFVIHELERVLKPGGMVVMVNDNVRYAGQEIPVDLILSDFASRFGMDIVTIWTLPRGKGNSSQQMGTHGRRELRKCVYVWRKR